MDVFMSTKYKDDPGEKHFSSHVHRYPFLAYVAAHWEEHDREALPFIKDDEASETWTLELRLLRSHELMESYLRARGQWDRQYHNGTFGLHVFVFERKTGMQYVAARGNLQRVSRLIEAGIDPNESMNNTTALIEASRGHHESVVRLLIEAKAGTHFRAGGSNHTALTVAIGMKGERGPSQNYSNLSQASRKFQKYRHHSTRARDSTVALLLEAGADPEHVTGDSENLTPLMHAAQHGMGKVVAMLCRAGADVDRRAGSDLWMTGGQTALHVAAAHGHESIVKQLLQYDRRPNSDGENQASPALCAAEGQHWHVLEFLLDTTIVDLSCKTLCGDSILELACGSKGCPDAPIQRLISTSPGVVNTSGRPLIRAAEAKKTAAVRMLLEAGADPCLTDRSGDTALHVLSKLDRRGPWRVLIGIAQALLREKMQVDTQARYGVTALMLASGGGQNELVKFLLQQGADMLLTDRGGWSLLSYAARGGHSDIASRLLHAGAAPQTDLSFIRAASFGNVDVLRLLTSLGIDVNKATEDGTTALMSAAKGGRLDVTKLLIEAGAVVNAPAVKSRSPLMISAARGYKDIMRLLLQNGADASVTNERGETPLVGVMRTEMRLRMENGLRRTLSARERHVILQENMKEVMSMLLGAGVDVNTSTNDGDTALMLATDPEYPNPDDVRVLLEAGADPAISELAENAALVSSNRIEKMDLLVLKGLLKAGANPNKHDSDGVNALMQVSSRRGQLDKLRLLLEYGASPDAVNNVGRTALTLAIHKANRDLCPKIVRELLNAGANPNHQDAGGKSVLFQLVSRDYRHDMSPYEEILTALVDAGGDISAIAKNRDTLLMLCIRRSGMVNPLLAVGADPQGRDKYGRNTVMLASMISSHDGTDAVRSLLDAGVDPNRCDYNGYNALMLAARYSRSPMTLRTLLRAGMNPHERDAERRTLIMLVLINQCASQSHIKSDVRSEMLSELIEAGVGVDLHDKNGNTALMYAAEHNRPAGPLLKAGADPNLTNRLGQNALMKCFLGTQILFKKTICKARDEWVDLHTVGDARDSTRTSRDAKGGTEQMGSGRNVLTLISARDIFHQNVEVAEQILKLPYIALHHADNNGVSALMCADRAGNKDIADLIRAEIKRRETSSKVKETVHHVLGGIEVPI